MSFYLPILGNSGHPSNPDPPFERWFAYDTICQLSFGEPIGFVRQARDVSNLIENFHDMAPFAAIVGALPWLCAPILQSPITKWLFMPRPGDTSGTGKIMAVRRIFHLVNLRGVISAYLLTHLKVPRWPPSRTSRRPQVPPQGRLSRQYPKL